MTTHYLPATNIVADLVRHPQGRVAQRITEVGEAEVCTSIIVASELRSGAERKGSTRLTAQLAAIEVIAFKQPADAAYGTIRTALERAGCTIGGKDLLIAAQAMTLGCTLVTDNVRECARIEGLKFENWLR